MLVIFLGDLTLILGFAFLLLPLLVTELSRPRDAIWGAVVLLLGLALLDSRDRFSGPLVLVVVLGALLIFRLGIEIAQSRWHQLGTEEKLRFGSLERWTTSLKQTGASIAELGGALRGLIKISSFKPTSKSIKKKWVRPEINKELQDSNQVSIQINGASQEEKAVAIKQPQETFEGHRASKDS